VEDVAAGHAQGLLEIEGGLRLDARAARGIRGDHALDGLGEHGVERREHRGLQALAELVVAEPLEEPVRHVQPEHREGLGAGCRELGSEDRAVAQGVAVDLARER
jgi:hypothetical protein